MFIQPLFDEDISILFNRIYFLLDARLTKLLINSLIIGLGSSIFALILGLPLGFLFARSDMNNRFPYFIASLLPLFIPPFCSTFAWISVLGHNGIFNRFIIKAFSLQSSPLNIYSFFGIITVLGFSYYPFVTILSYSGFSSINNRLEEASLICRSRLKTVSKISLSMAFPYIATSGLFVFILSFSNFSVPDMLRVNVFPVEIFIQFSGYFKNHMAIVSSLPILFVNFGVLILMVYLLKGKPFVSFKSRFQGVSVFKLGKYKPLFNIFVLIIIFFSVALPITVLMVNSGSFQAFRIALKSAQNQLLNSIIFAIIAASIGCILGFVMAYYIEHKKGISAICIDLITFFPIAVPGIILGIGLIITWNRPAFEIIYGGSGILVIAYLAKILPFTVKTFSSGIKYIDIQLEEASLLISNKWLFRMRKVVLPLSKHCLFAAWSIAYILCLGELSLSLLVSPPGLTTVPVRIYTLLHYGQSQLVNALSLILIFCGILPPTILFLLLKKNAIWRKFDPSTKSI